MTLRVISYNTQFCTGLDQVTDPARIAAEIGHGDIIGLQEIERHWSRTGDVDQAEAIGAALPDRYWVYGAGYDMDASRVVDGRVENRRRQFGNMILSRWPVLMSRNHLLPKLNLRGPMSLQRSALEAVIATPLGTVRVFSVHLAHAAASERRLQIARLMEIVADGRRDGGAWSGRDIPAGWRDDGPPVAVPLATLLLGDFNAVPGSPEHAMIVGETDPQFGSLALADGVVDAWMLAGEGGVDAPGATFGTAQGARRIDYIFCTADLAERLRAVRVLTEAVGSDHRPVEAVFEAEPAR